VKIRVSHQHECHLVMLDALGEGQECPTAADVLSDVVDDESA
jgi:hypothetical protein